MTLTEMGNPDGKTLLLLPGTACTWQLNFKNVVDDLAERYHVIAVNYDGFEGNPNVIFTDVPTVTEKIEDYILGTHGERYRRHFRDPDIHEFDMKHEAWLYDDAWRQPVLDMIVQCMER